MDGITFRDTIYAENGNDVIGGGGNDIINGGGGLDTAVYSGQEAGIRLRYPQFASY